MIEYNSLGKTFGPVGSFSGLLIFCAGLFLTVMAGFGGIVVTIIGAFVAFTRPLTSIDYDKKQVRNGDKLFGIVKTGKWIPVKASMKIGRYRSNKVYRTYSRSNRSLDIEQKQNLICLFNENGQKLMALKNIKDAEKLAIELQNMSDRLGVEQIS
ncbi:hypothetical protein [Carboxylicivirga sp. RSCT41]|uniref:hypothetical protein n=1 Tax=Carboxylicivirga agarovorans TaxID=3417570 RepID=UPI003D33B65C